MQRKALIVTFTLLQFFGASAFSQYSSGRSAKTISRTYGFEGLLADMGMYYSLTEATATPAAGNTWQTSTSVFDFKLGYIQENHFYYGLIYSGRNDDQVSIDQASGGSVGGGIGYFGYNGFNARGYYKFNDSHGEYKDGTGVQLDLGYAINPTSALYVGLNLSFRQTNYKTNATIAGFQSLTRNESYPFVTLGYLFF